MAGLLDFMQTPEGQGLLSAAFSGMANAQRGTPWNNAGRAGMGGLMGYSNAIERQDQQGQQKRRNEMTDMQIAQAKRAAETEEQIRLAGAASMKTPMQNATANGRGPTMENAAALETAQPSFDTSGFVNRVMGIDPLKGIALQGSMAKETPFNKVDPKDYTPESVAKFAKTRSFGDLMPVRKKEMGPAGQIWDPYAAKDGMVFNDPNKPFSIGENGPVANQGYQQYEIGKARAGAPNVSVKTDVKTGESLAGQYGPIMKDSLNISEGAVKQVDAAQRLVKAIDSGNVIVGPGANARLKVAQLSEMLGAGGKDEAERIANTRATLRGFAELTLQGRQQMKGQGAITESEGKLAEKAMSGDITDLTAAEIKQLAQASERAARFNYKEHQRKLNVIKAKPEISHLADMYQGPAMLDELTAPVTNGGWSIKPVQ